MHAIAEKAMARETTATRRYRKEFKKSDAYKVLQAELARLHGSHTPALIRTQPRRSDKNVGADALRAPKRARPSREQTCESDHHEDQYYTADELAQMDELFQFKIPSLIEQSRIRHHAKMSIAKSAQEQTPCCVCELDHCHDEIADVELTDVLAEQMERCISVPTDKDIPEFILRQYDASQKDARLSGLMLFPPGVKRNPIAKKTYLQLCATCRRHLEETRTASPPALGISNGNYIGHFPEDLGELSRTGEQAIALVLPCVSMATVTGGSCRTIKSHHYIVRNTEGPITEMLPRDLTNRVRVTMVGNLTPLQAAACKKRYEVNIAQCQRVLKFLYKCNRVYKLHRNTARPPASMTLHNTTVIIDKSSVVADSVVDSLRDETSYSGFGSMVIEGTDASLESEWIDRSSLIMENDQGWTDVLVRKSNVYVSLRGWQTCVEMFPTLFPGGCGGPKEPRKRDISVETWVKRCFRIHGHKFESHYAFLLLAFDYLACQNARETMFIKMNVSSHAIEAGKIPAKTVNAAIKYHKHLVDAAARGLKPNPPPSDVQRVIDLRKGLRTPESAFYGSNLSRMRARHDLFGFLLRFGTMQIFFTVSPDSGGTYSIAVKAGTVSASDIRAANARLLPTRAKLKDIASRYPVECARYFQQVMHIVIEDILGWDQKAHRPKRGGGIFGVVRAFGAAAETQIAGDLHAHFAIWLYGFPSTSGELLTKLRDNSNFRDRVINFADAVLTTKPPCMVEENTCGVCRNLSLVPVVPGVDAFRPPLPGSQPPTTSECSVCGAKFKDKDVIDNTVLSFQDQARERIIPQLVEFSKCAREAHDELNPLLVSSIVMREVQVHFWHHCKSCFKTTVRTPKGSVCRFLKPEPAQPSPTFIDGKLKVCLHRPIGCEYVNPFNPTVLEVFKCNHDIQLVLNSDARDTASYVCKYCMKRQNPVENRSALSLAAFTKATSNLASLPVETSDRDRGYKILSSMLYTITNGQEIAAPMAALYVLQQTPFWFSHDVLHLDLGKLLQEPSDTEEISVSASAANDTKPPILLRTHRELARYQRRPVALENVSFMTICEEYESAPDEVHGQNEDVFVTNAPVVPCFRFKKRSSPRVVVLCGRQLPDISIHQDKSSTDFYYAALMTLFKPHRRGTLLCENENLLTAYRDFISSADSINVNAMKLFEANQLDFFRAQRSDSRTEESAEDVLLRTRASASTPWRGFDQEEKDADPNDIEVCGPNDFELPDANTSDTVAREKSTAALIEEARSIVREIPNLDTSIASVGSSCCPVQRLQIDVRMPEYKAQLVTEASTADEDTMGTFFFLQRFKEAETRLERLDECFRPVPWNPNGFDLAVTPDTLERFPSIDIVSRSYCLNFWQHVIFEVAARHLLLAYATDIGDCTTEPLFPSYHTRRPYDIKPQLIAYLGGEAGTGKSTVVQALLTFARCWGREGSVETLAFTGVAAMNIQGRTIHSSRNLNISTSKPNGPATVEMKARFRRVVLVIIDELSMTDQSLLGGADTSSRGMAANPNAIMGSKHVLFIGDQLQLPPIGGFPCYARPPDTASPLRQAGYAAYCAINFVVFLIENMRARHDPEYTELLQDLRWGRLSEDQLRLLNTRVLAVPPNRPSRSSRDFYRPVVVSVNKLRCAINRDMMFRIAKQRSQTVYECIARPSARSKTIFGHVVNANDDLTGRIALRLQFFIGMPVMITHKHPDLTESGVIANGTIGTVVGFSPSNCELSCVEQLVEGVTVKRFVELPDLLLIRILNCDKVLVRGFPPGIIGLPPLHAKVKLTKIPNLSQASITVTQFALVPSFACTTEKLQGQTCHDGVIITPLDQRRGVPHQTLYVALSRSVSLEGVTLTETISREYLAKFKPSQSTIREMQRLIGLVRIPSYAASQERVLYQQWKLRQSITE